MQASAIVSEDLQQINLLPKVILLEKNSSGLMEKKKMSRMLFLWFKRSNVCFYLCACVGEDIGS